MNPELDLITGAQVSARILDVALNYATDSGDEETAAWIRPKLEQARNLLKELDDAELRRTGHSEGALHSADSTNQQRNGSSGRRRARRGTNRGGVAPAGGLA